MRPQQCFAYPKTPSNSRPKPVTHLAYRSNRYAKKHRLSPRYANRPRSLASEVARSRTVGEEEGEGDPPGASSAEPRARMRAPSGKKEREGGRIRAPRQRQSAPSPHVVAVAMPCTAAWEREEESKAAAWEREDRRYFAFAVGNGRIWVAHSFTVP